MLSTRLRTSGLFLVFPLGVTLAVACSAGKAGSGPGSGNGSTGSGAGNGNGGGVTGAGGALTTLTGVGVTTTSSITGDSGPVTCDGSVCCPVVNIASIGLPANYGCQGQDNTTAFTDWLNTASNNTATATMFTTRASFTLNEAFLSQYQVLIVQLLADGTPVSSGGYSNLSYWTFTSDEVAALTAWAQVQGHGIISMSGYVSASTSTTPAEIGPENQLLGFSGLTYQLPDIITGAYPTGMSNQYAYCVGESVPITTWNTASPIYSSNLKSVGAFHAYSINIGSTASAAVVLASGDANGNPTPATYNYGVSLTGGPMGAGRLFMWMDEWVTYTSQWQQGDTACVASGSAANCANEWGSDVYQVGQFWDNALTWVSNSTCFQLTGQGIVQIH